MFRSNSVTWWHEDLENHSYNVCFLYYIVLYYTTDKEINPYNIVNLKQLI